MCRKLREMLDREDSDAECMALDLRTKLEWIASVLEIAEENEGLGGVSGCTRERGSKQPESQKA